MLFERRGIVIACDVTSLDALGSLVEKTAHLEQVTGYKVGFSLALRFGLIRAVEAIRTRTSKPVIYDHQKAGTDIPQTGTLFADVCVESHIDGAILFPHAGPATLEAWAVALRDRGITPIVGAVMTHAHFTAREGGFLVDGADRAIYRLALALGVAHFVLPATKPECVATLREESDKTPDRRIVVLSPGIGRQKAETSAARQVFGKVNWSPIVGSAIYASDDPAGQVSAIAQELRLQG